MNKKIIFGSLLVIAFCWVIYSLFLFQYNAKNTLNPSVFFSENDTVIVINNSKEYLNKNNNVSLTFQQKRLDSILSYMTKQSYFDQFYFTSKDSLIDKMMIEANRTINSADLHSLFLFLNLDTTNLIINEKANNKGLNFIAKRQYIAISTHDFDTKEKPVELSLNFNNCDKKATYNIISKLERTAVYQNTDEPQKYITQQTDGNYLPVNDNDFYAVIPSATSSFLFIEKELLIDKIPEWKDNQLLKAIDFGVLKTLFEGNEVDYFQINGLFTPSELIETFCSDTVNRNAKVVPLSVSIPGFKKPYATFIENAIIIADSKSSLENIRIQYQIGKLFNSTELYVHLMKDNPQRVNLRWWGKQDLNAFGLNTSEEGSVVYQPKYNQRVIAMQDAKTTKQANPTSKINLLWSTSVGDASAIASTNGVIAIWDKTNNLITLTNLEGKIIRKITPQRTFLQINALSYGFTLIGKTNMLWIPTNEAEKTVEYDFKEQLQNIAADYTWRGEQQIGFLTEKELICFNISDSKTTSYKLNNKITPSNFYAFNLEGDLAFSITNENETIIYNTKTKEKTSNKRSGKIVATEKIDLQVFYLLKDEIGYNLQVNEASKQKLAVSTDYQFFAFQHNSNLSCIVFRKNEQFVTYNVFTQEFKNFVSPINSVEKVALVSMSNTKNRIYYLDGVQNNIYLQDENQLNNDSEHLEGSHFIYAKSSNQLITFLDGNLICYQFN